MSTGQGVRARGGWSGPAGREMTAMNARRVEKSVEQPDSAHAGGKRMPGTNSNHTGMSGTTASRTSRGGWRAGMGVVDGQGQRACDTTHSAGSETMCHARCPSTVDMPLERPRSPVQVTGGLVGMRRKGTRPMSWGASMNGPLLA